MLCGDGELISKLLLSVCSLLYPSDGKLKEGDQILAINGQPLDQSVSHQQAIVLLQRASDCVSLTVARGPVPQLSSPVVSRTPSAASTLSAHSSAVRQTHTHTDLVFSDLVYWSVSFGTWCIFPLSLVHLGIYEHI